MMPIKVVVADDHTLFREGIRRILSLEKDILVVGEASRGDEVAKVVERAKPDVLLLDLKMPKGDVVQTLLEIKEKNLTTKVLILTAYSEDENILNAAKGGERGYVLKGIGFPTLLQAIKSVHKGGLWIDKEMPAAEAFEEIAQGQMGEIDDDNDDDQAAGRGDGETGFEVPLVNKAAVDYLLKRGYQMDSFIALFMSDEPLGKFENYICTSPPFFV